MEMKMRLSMAGILSALIGLSGISSADAQSLNPERRTLSPDFLDNIRAGQPESFSALAPIHIRRSLMVTDERALAGLTLRMVMDKLAGEGSEAGADGATLFRRWMDTNNTRAGRAFADNAWHCEFESAAQGGSATFNATPLRCPRPEGVEASSGTPDDYITIAAVNRLDLAGDGRNSCGEYRLIFARNTGVDDFANRNLLIFEMDIDNPEPERGIAACKPLAEFWISLSGDMPAADRAGKLRDFYFSGLEGFGPAVAIRNLGADPLRMRGQVRTNQFATRLGDSGAPWVLREYRARLDGGKVRFLPDTVKSTPATDLFGTREGDPRAALASLLADSLTSQLDTLSAGRRDFVYAAPSGLDAGESDETNPGLGDAVTVAAAHGDSIVRKRLRDALGAAESGLTDMNIITRVGALTCAGCHQHVNGADLGNGEAWPAKGMAFVHVSERAGDREDCEGIGQDTCFGISNTLKELLLPARLEILEAVASVAVASTE